MSGIAEKIPIKNKLLDKRVKLTPRQRREIISLYFIARVSLRGLGRLYGVDKKTIKFVVDPAFYQKELARNKGNSSKYYTKEKHRLYMQKHRLYKKELYLKNLI